MYENNDSCESLFVYSFRSFNMKINNMTKPKNLNQILINEHKICVLPYIYGCVSGKTKINRDVIVQLIPIFEM